MATVTGPYLGDLRVECRHEQSGATLLTDAPVDNHGKGQSFSPTDMVAAALGACASTVIGVYGQAHGVDVTGMTVEVTKTMSDSPHRISRLEVVFTMPRRSYSAREKISIERAAHSCAVHKSLAGDIEQMFTFVWPE